MPFLNIDGLRTHYQTLGKGPAVLLIHGWASSWRLWARTMTRLARNGYQAWAVDLIGFGESDKPGDGWYTLDRFTRTLAEFCDRLDITRPGLIGHSMGGTIALNLALARETRAVVAASPIVNGELTFSLHTLLTSPMARRLIGWMRRRSFFSALGDMRLVAAPGLFRDPVRRRTHEDVRATTLNAAVGGLRMVVRTRLEERLPRLATPVLVIVGERDLTVAPSQGRLAARLIPGARLVSWPDAGHALVDERGDAFDALVLDHLRTQTSEV